MKKLLTALVLSLAFISGCLSFPVAAQNTITDYSYTEYEYFDDGSYLATTVTVYAGISRSSTKSGSKTTTYNDSTGAVVWSYTVNGTFTYTGSSATCTYVSDTYSVNSSNWSVISHSCSKSANNAVGTATAKCSVSGVIKNTVPLSVTLTCSPTGVLS